MNRHACFVALTRPPMRWGVTVTFVMLNALFHLFLFILSRRLGVPFWGIVLSVGFFHGLGCLACRCDARFFDVALGRMAFDCQNKDFWGCLSYEAY